MAGSVIVTTGASLLRSIPNEFLENFEISKAVEFLNTLDDPLNNRAFGAEINSTVSMIEKGLISPLQNIFMLHSATDEGRFIGRVLKEFWIKNRFGYTFNYSDSIEIKGLDDKNPRDFKNKGLRNLVKEMARIYRNHRDVVINATGGYKAQIALATVLGQALKIPVYYRFEAFDHVIRIIPLPLEISSEIVKEYLGLFIKLECSQDGISKEEFRRIGGWKSSAEVSEFLMLLIDEADGKYTLSPMGQIYFEGVEISYEDLISKKVLLSEKAPDEKLRFTGKEAHSQKLIEKYMSDIRKVLEMKVVDEVDVIGSGERYTTEKVKVIPEKNEIKVLISHSKENLILIVKTKCSTSDKVNRIIGRKIEEILKGEVHENF